MSITDPTTAGLEAANTVDLTYNMRSLLARHGFGAAFMSGLTTEEEDRLPDAPDHYTDEDRDDWNYAFATRMDERGEPLLNPVVAEGIARETGSTLVEGMAVAVDPNITLVDFVTIVRQEGHR